MAERMPTGIPGLDHLLEGGLVRGNSLLIEGPPGSGKSTLGVRILSEGVSTFSEPGLLITFEEFPRQVYAEALAHGVDLRSLEEAGALRVIWTPPSRVVEAFNGKSDLLDRIIAELGVRRIVIDSITHFKRVAGSETAQRELLAAILNGLKLKGITTIAVKELERCDAESIAFEEYLVDASIRLYNVPAIGGGENARLLEVRKTRGQGHISGRHPFRLDTHGLRVFPHLRPADVERTFGEVSPPQQARVRFGIAGLDQMLDGGVWRGSLNLVAGYPGTGKSVVAYHFIDCGLRAGEPALALTIKHPPEQIVSQAASLGLHWDAAWREGRLRFLYFHPTGLCVEELLHELTVALGASVPARFVFDSANDLWHAVKDDDSVRDYILVLTRLVERAGTTTLMLNETRQMGGAPSGDAQDYAYLASSVIQLSMAESDGELRRFVGIRKHSGSDHAKELREFQIDSHGFRVERKATGLSGILTGQTQGSLRQMADEVLPALDETTALLRAASDASELPTHLRASLKTAHSNLGLLDILLREHFGVTAFHQLVADITETPAAGRRG